MKKLINTLQANHYWQQTRNGYELRSPRDQRIIQIASVALLTTLIYLVLWQPITTWSQRQQAAFLHQKSINQWMQQHIKNAEALQKSATRGDASSTIKTLAQQIDITLAQTQPEQQGLSVWIADTAYQKLLKWMVLLQTEHDIAVKQIRIDSLPEDGRVKSHIVFSY